MFNLIILPVLVVMLYPIIAGFALRMASSARLDFADCARKLLQDPSVTEDHKIIISGMVDDVFDWKFMAWATIVFPFVAFSGRAERELSEADREFFNREDTRRLVDLHMRSVMAASPFFTVAFFLVALVTFAAVFLFFGLSMVNMIWADTVKHISPHAGSRPPINRIVH